MYKLPQLRAKSTRPGAVYRSNYMNTCGIYKLIFCNYGQYIGKSINIEKRYTEHLLKLQKGVHTKSMQKAYDISGIPILKILQVCHKDWLTILETIHGSHSKYRLKNLNTTNIDNNLDYQTRRLLLNSTKTLLPLSSLL